ncbi:Cell wall-associated hydrolase, NlpC family [Mitsuaria sp. PDC51]|uniref:C40 family peptidase n=1 Tax=unclassified Roseateles TaxID=2626991 RepID=UPI0008F174C8|nr:Cell wall-associated hydrolase, NlpC family [Mitsuaria sp. PDC51]
MAALGLICVLASGSCWAQQSTSSTTDKPKAQAKAAPAKPAAKKKPEAKTAKTAKASKDTKAAKPVASKNGAKDSKAKADDDKASTAAEAVTDKAVAAKPEAKVAEKTADKAAEKTSEKTAPARSEAKTPDAKADARAEAAPPAGTMMGAYGQSLMRTPAGTAAATTAVAGATAALVAAAPATPAPVATTNASALPPTALMGAAVGNANANASDSVARFLQQRGIVAQAQQLSPSADPAAPGLLNQVRDKASDLVLSAMNFLGVPYKRGGNSVSNGFDCSGFTRHIFEMSVGLVLPRRADEQAKLSSLVPIKKEDLKPGDLVFFNTMRATFSHVGIYVGEGKFIHSPRVGGAVRVEDMREAYWAKRFTGARRADLNQANAGT